MTKPKSRSREPLPQPQPQPLQSRNRIVPIKAVSPSLKKAGVKKTQSKPLAGQKSTVKLKQEKDKDKQVENENYIIHTAPLKPLAVPVRKKSKSKLLNFLFSWNRNKLEELATTVPKNSLEFEQHSSSLPTDSHTKTDPKPKTKTTKNVTADVKVHCNLGKEYEPPRIPVHYLQNWSRLNQKPINNSHFAIQQIPRRSNLKSSTTTTASLTSSNKNLALPLAQSPTEKIIQTRRMLTFSPIVTQLEPEPEPEPDAELESENEINHKHSNSTNSTNSLDTSYPTDTCKEMEIPAPPPSTITSEDHGCTKDLEEDLEDAEQIEIHQMSDSPTNSELLLHALLEIETKFQESQQLKQKHATEMKENGRNHNRVTAKLKTNTALEKLHEHAQDIITVNENNKNYNNNNKTRDENCCDSNDIKENDVSNCSSDNGENGRLGNACKSEIKSKLFYPNFNGNGGQFKPNYNTFPTEYYEYENGRIYGYGVNKDNNNCISSFKTPYEHSWAAVALDKKEYKSCKAMLNCDDLQRANSNSGITDLTRGLALGYQGQVQGPRGIGLGLECDLTLQENGHFNANGQGQGALPATATAAWVYKNFSNSCSSSDTYTGLPIGRTYQAGQNANFKPTLTHGQTSKLIASNNNNPNSNFTAPVIQNAPNFKVLDSDSNFNSCTYDYEGLIPAAEPSPILRVLRNNQVVSSTSTNHQNSYLPPGVNVTTNVLNSNTSSATHGSTNILKQKQIEVQIQTETSLTISEKLDTSSQPLRSASVSKNVESILNQNLKCNAATSISAEGLTKVPGSGRSGLAPAHAQPLKTETKTPEDGSGDDDTKETKKTASTELDADKKQTQHSTANSSLSSSNHSSSYHFTKSSSVPVSSHNIRTKDQGPNDKKPQNLNVNNLNSWLREGKKFSTKELPPDINNNRPVIVNVAETHRTKLKDRDCSMKMIKSKAKKKKPKPTQNQSQNEEDQCQSRSLNSARSRSNQVKFEHARNNVDSTSRGRKRCRSKKLIKEKTARVSEVNDECDDGESNVVCCSCDVCCGCNNNCSCTDEPAARAPTCCELVEQFPCGCQCQSSMTSQKRTTLIKRTSSSKSSSTLLGYCDEPKGAVGKLKKLNPRLAKATKNQTDPINTDKGKGVTAHAKSPKLDIVAKNKESKILSKDGSEVDIKLDSKNSKSLSPVSKTSISSSGSSHSSNAVNREEVKSASLPLAFGTSDSKTPPEAEAEAEASSSSALLTLLSPEKSNSSTSIVGTSVNVEKPAATTQNRPKLKSLSKIPLKPAPKTTKPAFILSPLTSGSGSPTLSKSNSSSLKTPPDRNCHLRNQYPIFKPFCYTRTQSQPPVPVPVIMPIRNRICRPLDPHRRIFAQTEGPLRMQTQTRAQQYSIQCQKQTLTLPAAAGVALSTKDIQCMILNSTLKRPLDRKYCGLNRKLGLSSARLARTPSWKLKQLEIEQLEREMRSNGCSTTSTATENRGTHSSNHCLAMSTSTSTLCESACEQYQTQHAFNNTSSQQYQDSSGYGSGSENLCAGAKIFLDDTGTEGTPQFLVCETASGTQLELEVCPLDEDEVEVQVQEDGCKLITPANTLRSNPCQQQPRPHDPGPCHIPIPQCHGPDHPIRGRDRCNCPDNLVAEPCCVNGRQQPFPCTPNVLANAQVLYCNPNVAVSHYSHAPARPQGFRRCNMSPSPGLIQASPAMPMPDTSCNCVENQDRGLFIQVPIHLAPKVFQPQLQLQPYPFIGHNNNLNNSSPAARMEVPPHRSSGSSYKNDDDDSNSTSNNNAGLKSKNANTQNLNRFYSPTQQNRNSMDSNKYSDSTSISNNSNNSTNSRFSPRKKQK